MKRLLILTLFLSGCAWLTQPVPVVPKFPDPTPELMKKCEELRMVEGDKVPVTDFLKTVVNNYTMYYQCSNKVDGWQDRSEEHTSELQSH